MGTVDYRAIAGYPDYRVGDDGSVWSCKSGEWKRLKPGYRRDYLKVELCGCGSIKSHNVHKLVLEAFVGPRPEGCYGCHNNGDAGDCSLGNLRWGSPSSNELDKLAHGTHLEADSHPRAKLTSSVVREIRVRQVAGEAKKALAREFGVSPRAIDHVLSGRNWKSVI